MTRDDLLLDLNKEGLISENLEEISAILDKPFLKVNHIFVRYFENRVYVYTPEDTGFYYIIPGKEYTLRLPYRRSLSSGLISTDSHISFTNNGEKRTIYFDELDSYSLNSEDKTISLTIPHSNQSEEDLKPVGAYIDIVIDIYNGGE